MLFNFVMLSSIISGVAIPVKTKSVDFVILTSSEDERSLEKLYNG